MTTIDRYIAKTFLVSYLILLTLGIGSYIVGDLLVNLDEFTENRELGPFQIMGVMVDYYGHNLPLYFSQLAGPVMAFAAAYTLAMMLRQNEMTALVAAGMPLQRLAVPIMVCSVFLVGLWMVNREFVLPAFAHQIARSRDDVTGTSTTGINFARDDHDAILTANRIRLQQGRLEGVVIVEPQTHGMSVIQADAAIYDPRAKTWRLEAGRRIIEGGQIEPDGREVGLRREPISEYPFTLSPEELILRQSSQWAGMLSLRQMNALMHSKNLPNLAAVVMQRHIWLTSPLLQWLLLALALPFFLTREPTSVLVAGGWALLLCGAFFAVQFFAHGTMNVKYAELVAWVPILLFAPVAVLQFANVKT